MVTRNLLSCFVFFAISVLAYHVVGTDYYHAYAICCFPYDIFHYMDPETGYLVVEGQLWNDSYKSEPFGKVNYQFVFYDSERNVLFERDLALNDGHPIKEGFVIPPGIALPFHVVVDDVDKDIIREVDSVSSRSTNALEYFSWKPADLKINLDDLELFSTINDQENQEIFFKWKISGTITNTHSEKAENVYVVASLLDEEDRFLGTAGYSGDGIQPMHLDGFEVKEFVIYSILPSDKTPDNVYLYAESDKSSMAHRHYNPVILKNVIDHEGRHATDPTKPILISANVTNISRDNLDLNWIIQIKKSPKGIAEGDMTKYPQSKIELVERIPVHVGRQQSMLLEYPWMPQHGGIYFYEMFLWDNDNRPASYPFTGNFFSQGEMFVYPGLYSIKNQIESGKSFDELVCRKGLELAHRTSNANFVCIKPESIPKLAERGWITETKKQIGQSSDKTTGPIPQWTFQSGVEVSVITISDDDSSLVTIGGKGDQIEDKKKSIVYLLDRNGSPLWSHVLDMIINDIAMSSDGRFIAVSGYQPGDSGIHVYQNGIVYLLNSDGDLLWEYLMDDNNVPWSLWIHPEGSSVSLGTGNKVISLDRQGDLLWEINAEKYFDYVAFSSDGYFVTGYDSDVLFFDSTGKLLWSFATKYESNYGLMISQDGKNILVSDSSGTDGNIYYLDSDGNLLWEHHLDEAALHLAISEHDNSYLMASNNWQLMMFDEQGNLLWTNNIPSDVAMSPDGSLIAGTTFNNGAGPAITLFDIDGNITAYHLLENHVLFSLSDDGKHIAVTDGADKDQKVSFFEIEKLMMNQDKINLSAMQASDELHVKAVPQDGNISFDVTLNQGESLQIPWDIYIENGYTTTNLRTSTESQSSPELESWIIPHTPYSPTNGRPPSDKMITVHANMGTRIGQHTLDILASGYSIHNQTGWMTDLADKPLGMINVQVNPSETTMSIDIGNPLYERHSFCVDTTASPSSSSSGNDRTCSSGTAYQTVPVTVFSDNLQTVHLEPMITQKGGWIKFIPEMLEAGPDGTRSDMVMAGYLIPFKSNPLAEQPLIIQATSQNGEKTTKVIPVRFGEISVIDNEDSAIALNQIRANSNGTSYAISGVVYDPFDDGNSYNADESLEVSLSVLGMWNTNDDGSDIGKITDLPTWLSVDISESSFVLDANVPHHFIVIANTANAPESGTYHVAIKQNIGDKGDFVELQKIIIENRR